MKIGAMVPQGWRMDLNGINPEDHKDKLDLLLQKVKEKEFKGHAFDQALASFEILARKTLFGLPDYFELVRFKVIDDRRWNAKGELVTESEATVRITINGEEFMNVEVGNGPVNALDKALRKSLISFYPTLQDLELTDFKVRILSSAKGVILFNKSASLFILNFMSSSNFFPSFNRNFNKLAIAIFMPFSISFHSFLFEDSSPFSTTSGIFKIAGKISLILSFNPFEISFICLK